MVAVDLDDLHALLVHADALQQAGDVHGELIAVQCERERAPTEALARRERALIRTLGLRVGRMLCKFRRGFVVGVELQRAHKPAEDLAELFGHRAARVEEVAVTGDYKPLLAGLAAAPRPTVRTLRLNDREPEFEFLWSGPDEIEPIWSALPSLRLCVMQGDRVRLGTIVAPRLETLVFRSGAMHADNVRWLAGSSLPALASLELWIGRDDQASVGVEDFDWLFAGATLPSLRHLKLRMTPWTQELASRLADAPLLDRLETLDLSGGVLVDPAPLFTPRFARLARVDVGANLLPPGAALPPNTVGPGQRTDTIAPQVSNYIPF